MATTRLHTAWKEDHFDGTDPIDFEIATPGTFKMAFFKSAVTIDADTTSLYGTAPLDANEVSGTGYTSGGVSLANFTVSMDGGTAVIDCDDISQIDQDAGGFNDATHAVVYEVSSNKVIWSETQAFEYGNAAGPLNYGIDADGLIRA